MKKILSLGASTIVVLIPSPQKAAFSKLSMHFKP